MKNKLHYAPVLLFFILFSCKTKTDAPSPDPEKAVVGKWQLIEVGNWPIMAPIKSNGFLEFQPDSVLHYINAEKNDRRVSKYYFRDSILYRGALGYKTMFYEDKMRLDILNASSVHYTSVYQRVKD